MPWEIKTHKATGQQHRLWRTNDGRLLKEPPAEELDQIGVIDSKTGAPAIYRGKISFAGEYDPVNEVNAWRKLPGVIDARRGPNGVEVRMVEKPTPWTMERYNPDVWYEVEPSGESDGNMLQPWKWDWAEPLDHIGDIPEYLGAVGGGATAAALTGFTPAVIPAVATGEGLGAGFGIKVRQEIAKRMGIEDRTDEQLNEEAVLGGIMNAAGSMIAPGVQVLGRKALEKGGNAALRLVSGTSGLSTPLAKELLSETGEEIYNTTKDVVRQKGRETQALGEAMESNAKKLRSESGRIRNERGQELEKTIKPYSSKPVDGEEVSARILQWLKDRDVIRDVPRVNEEGVEELVTIPGPKWTARAGDVKKLLEYANGVREIVNDLGDLRDYRIGLDSIVWDSPNPSAGTLETKGALAGFLEDMVEDELGSFGDDALQPYLAQKKLYGEADGHNEHVQKVLNDQGTQPAFYSTLRNVRGTTGRAHKTQQALNYLDESGADPAALRQAREIMPAVNEYYNAINNRQGPKLPRGTAAILGGGSAGMAGGSFADAALGAGASFALASLTDPELVGKGLVMLGRGGRKARKGLSLLTPDSDRVSRGPVRYSLLPDEDEAKRLDPLGGDTVVNASVAPAPEGPQIAGIVELQRRAQAGDKEAASLLSKIAAEGLQQRLAGAADNVTVGPQEGRFAGQSEPGAFARLSGNINEQRVIDAGSDFGKTYKQQQIHALSGARPNTPYLQVETDLAPEAIQNIMDEAGVLGVSLTPGGFTIYFPGEDPQAASELFSNVLTLMQQRTGTRPNAKTGLVGLEALGSGDGATRPYTAGSFDFQADPAPVARATAEYLAGRPVPTFEQNPLSEGHKWHARNIGHNIYPGMPDNDLDNPLVAAAYEALAKKTREQTSVLPVDVEVHARRNPQTGAFELTGGEPYPNSDAMRQDVGRNAHLYIYGTDKDTFGPPGMDFSGHPLLGDSGLKDVNGYPMLLNDAFRGIHDYFAHSMTPTQFGPAGEWAGYGNHAATLLHKDPKSIGATENAMARWALASETHGQNSTVNFGPGREALPIMERDFAPQKTGLLPIENTLTMNREVDDQMVDLARTLSREERKGSRLSNSVVPEREDLGRILGWRVRDIEDLTSAMSVYNDPYESFRLVGLKNGTITHHYATTSKNPRAVRLSWKELLKKAQGFKRDGVEELYIVHNHPTGKSKMSRADDLSARHLTSIFEKSGDTPRVAGALITGPESGGTVWDPKAPHEARRVGSYLDGPYSERPDGKIFGNPADAMAQTEKEGNWLYLTNGRLELVEKMPIPENLSEQRLRQILAEKGRTHGVVNAFASVDERSSDAFKRNLYKLAPYFTDVFEEINGRQRSMQELAKYDLTDGWGTKAPSNFAKAGPSGTASIAPPDPSGKVRETPKRRWSMDGDTAERIIGDSELASGMRDLQKHFGGIADVVVRDSAPGGIEAAGMWQDGRIVIFRNNIRDLEHLRATFLHEAVGHEGIRRVLGSDLQPQLQRLVKARPELVREIRQMYGDLPETELAEEVLARLAEKDAPVRGVYKQVLGRLRELASRRLKVDFSEADVLSLLGRAENAARGGFRGVSYQQGRRAAMSGPAGAAVLRSISEDDYNGDY